MLLRFAMRISVPFILSSGLVACSIIPDAADVSSLNKVFVKAATQCEMRDAWVDVLNEGLSDRKHYEQARKLSREEFDRYQPPPGSNLAVEKAKFEADRFREFLNGGYRKLEDGIIEQQVDTYSTAYLGYRYLFDVTETNGLGAGITLTGIVPRGFGTYPIGSSFEGKRQAVTDAATRDVVAPMLVDEARIRVCNHLRSTNRLPNYAHPIVGKLGLRDLVKQFITDNQSGNLIGQLGSSDVFSFEQAPKPTETFTITFTTTMGGGLKEGTIALDRPMRGTAPTGWGFGASAERIDKHKLTIVMQLPEIGGLTVAERRNKAGVAARNAQALSLAREFRRIDDQNTYSRLVPVAP